MDVEDKKMVNVDGKEYPTPHFCPVCGSEWPWAEEGVEIVKCPCGFDYLDRIEGIVDCQNKEKQYWQSR